MYIFSSECLPEISNGVSVLKDLHDSAEQPAPPESDDQLKVLKDPLRFKIWITLQNPKSVAELAEIVGLDRRALYYQVSTLLSAALIEEVGSRQVRGCIERIYKKLEVNINSTKDDETRRESAKILILNLISEQEKEWRKILETKGKCKFIFMSDKIRIKEENIPAVCELIRKMTYDCNEQIKNLNDNEGDVEYRWTTIQYKID
jgi:hypothetical protein